MFPAVTNKDKTDLKKSANEILAELRQERELVERALTCLLRLAYLRSEEQHSQEKAPAKRSRREESTDKSLRAAVG
jgi:hypothetical protein